MTGFAELIQDEQANPVKPIISGLLNEGEIAGLHGPPEVFKTTFCVQLAECLAQGRPLFGLWPVAQPRRVFFLETEMSASALARRLHGMYSHQAAPRDVHVARDAKLREFRRASGLQAKFALLNDWVIEAQAEVVILDTCNPFFRGKEDPNGETSAGLFFDLLADLPVLTKLFVRHNHKAREGDALGDPSTRIRGSGQFVDVPDLLVELRRKNKRTNEAVLEVTKFRHGTRPDDLKLWWDKDDFRLYAIPPVIRLLQAGPSARPDLLVRLKSRYSIDQSKADEMIVKERPFLTDHMDVHRRVFDIDWDAAQSAPWYQLLGPAQRVCETSLAQATTEGHGGYLYKVV